MGETDSLHAAWLESGYCMKPTLRRMPVLQYQLCKARAESRAAALYGNIGARVMEMTLYI